MVTHAWGDYPWSRIIWGLKTTTNNAHNHLFISEFFMTPEKFSNRTRCNKMLHDLLSVTRIWFPLPADDGGWQSLKLSNEWITSPSAWLYTVMCNKLAGARTELGLSHNNFLPFFLPQVNQSTDVKAALWKRNSRLKEKDLGEALEVKKDNLFEIHEEKKGPSIHRIK